MKRSVPCVLLMSWSATGCVTTGNIEAIEPEPTVAAANMDRVALWEAFKSALRSRGFQLDLVDERTGRLTTRPVTSQHFFEFWRHDVVSARDRWEASLCSVRRTAEITLESSPDSPQTERFTVTVRVERISEPDRQVNNSAAVFQFFANLLPATRTGRTITDSDTNWVEMGRDADLEQQILTDILGRVEIGPGAADETSVPNHRG